MNIKLFSESSEHIWVNQEGYITVLMNDISNMVNQIYILNFMLFKQKYTNFFLILGVSFFFATGVIFLHTVSFFLHTSVRLKNKSSQIEV